MEKYANKGSNSGVAGFSAGKDYIQVQFRDGSVYLYNYQAPGKKHVEKMKALAKQGAGLNTYISQHVGGNYVSSLKVVK